MRKGMSVEQIIMVVGGIIILIFAVMAAYFIGKPAFEFISTIMA